MNHKGTKTQRLFICFLCVFVPLWLKKEWSMPDYEPIPPATESIAKQVVDAAFSVHKNLGPGLLESVYEVCLCHELSQRSVPFRHQISLPVVYDSIRLDAGLRLDILAGEAVVVEVKAAEKHHPVFDAQLLTYLKLTGHRLGLLINFNVPLIKDGIKRIVR